MLRNYSGVHMKSVLRCAFAIMLLLSLGGFADLAHATIIFQYQSSCATNCAALGLNAGDLVSGTVGVADAAVVPNAAVLRNDITSLDLPFGGSTFGLPTLRAFDGQLNSMASAFTAYRIFGSTRSAP